MSQSNLRLAPSVLAFVVVSTFTAVQVGAQDGGVIFQDPPENFSTWGDVPGLCHLEFRFRDGDHHLKTIRAIPDLWGRYLRFDLADNDHGQDAYGRFRWWDLRWNGSLRFANGSGCRDGCWLRIPPVSGSQELVLAGIDFSFSGDDRHIRDLEVWPYPESGWIWTRFRDNGTTNSYRVSVAYVLIPKADHYRFTSSSTRDEWFDIDRPKAAGKSYIQGFKARFRNGDHHFQQLRVNVCGNRVEGTFHDGGGVNDPYRLDVRYVTYQPIR